MDLKDPLDKFLLETVMWEMGLLPLDFSDDDVGRRLAQLAPDEAHRLKRRFRKVWRKIARETTDKSVYGMGDLKPTRKKKKMRKYIVFYHCLRQAREKKERLLCKRDQD